MTLLSGPLSAGPSPFFEAMAIASGTPRNEAAAILSDGSSIENMDSGVSEEPVLNGLQVLNALFQSALNQTRSKTTTPQPQAALATTAATTTTPEQLMLQTNFETVSDASKVKTGTIDWTFGESGWTFQAGANDTIQSVRDPLGQESDNVLRIDFKQGVLTSGASNPRAELRNRLDKLGGAQNPLQLGKTYNMRFKTMTQADALNSIFFQVHGQNKAAFVIRDTSDGKVALYYRANPSQSSMTRLNLDNVTMADLKNKWSNWDVEFKPGKGNGYVTIKLNGRVVASVPNLTTEDQNYFKMGLYRTSSSAPPVSIFLDDFTLNAR